VSTWPPAGPGTAASRQQIADAYGTRPGPDPRDQLRRQLWRVLMPSLTSAGWRRLRDSDMDVIVQLVEQAARDIRQDPDF
jgi:hypothetical protein